MKNAKIDTRKEMYNSLKFARKSQVPRNLNCIRTKDPHVQAFMIQNEGDNPSGLDFKAKKLQKQQFPIERIH